MTLRRHLLALLLPAFLLAQWLGLVHGVAHARTGSVAPLAAAAAAPASQAAASGLDALFTGHDSVTCRIVDQLGHGDLLPCVPVQLAPMLPPALQVLADGGRLLVLLAAAFQARAPPVLR